MISIEPQWSCFVVSDNNKQKASYLNAVITNNITCAKLRAESNSVGLHFNNNNLADSEYKLLDSLFGFGFEFALTSNSRQRSSVLQQALRSIPDARLLLIRQLDDSESSAMSLDRLAISSAILPQECVVSFEKKSENHFYSLDHLGEFLNILH